IMHNSGLSPILRARSCTRADVIAGLMKLPLFAARSSSTPSRKPSYGSWRPGGRSDSMGDREYRTLADLAFRLHAGDAAAAAETCRRAADWWEGFAEGPYQHRAAAWRAAAEHLEQLADSVRHTTMSEVEESMKWDVDATQYVVIDDGAYVYPVLREDLGPDDTPDALEIGRESCRERGNV